MIYLTHLVTVPHIGRTHCLGNRGVQSYPRKGSRLKAVWETVLDMDPKSKSNPNLKLAYRTPTATPILELG